MIVALMYTYARVRKYQDTVFHLAPYHNNSSHFLLLTGIIGVWIGQDTDFKDWIGPLTLADVLNVATIRVMTDDAGAELAHIERHQQVLQRHRAVLQTHQRQELMQQHPEQQLQQRYQHARREPQLQDIRQMSAMVGLRMM